MTSELNPNSLYFLPVPRHVERLGGECVLNHLIPRVGSAGNDPDGVARALAALRDLAAEDPANAIELRVGLDADPELPAQGYQLRCDAAAVTLHAPDAAGLFYGIQTLRQLFRQRPMGRPMPALLIRDWPDLPARGFMLDISRDKVPTMTTLRRLVDLLAEWKFNQFQLYMEHTFAYAGHEAVWRDASPMTADEIRELDAYCGERFIELVPNQNSFGHMERWLRHDAYAPLAEDPARRLTLCPIDPGSVALMRDLYGRLLPNFTSRRFNIGCDETWELGEGRSREACAERGKGRVYLEYLLELCALAREHGRTPMFWGDIVLKHPELIGELPRDAIALQWGYEADEPREEDSARFEQAGVPFYVCPGTSGWNSLIGRGESWESNIPNAARLAREHHAAGLLLTDWGDNGHWQHWPILLPALATGAQHAWCAVAAGQFWQLQDALAMHAVGDRTGSAALSLMTLVFAQSQAHHLLAHNASPLFTLLQKPGEPLPAGLTASDLTMMENCLEGALESLNLGAMRCDDAELIEIELRHGAALAFWTCRLTRERLAAGGSVAAIPAATRRALHRELAALVGQFRFLWLARNRPGGLEDSLRRFIPVSTALGYD